MVAVGIAVWSVDDPRESVWRYQYSKYKAITVAVEESQK